MKKRILLISSLLLVPYLSNSMDVAGSGKKKDESSKEVRIDVEEKKPAFSLQLPPEAGSRRFKQDSSKSNTGSKSTVRGNDELLGHIQLQRAKSVQLKKVVKSKEQLPQEDEEISIDLIDPATKKRSMLLPKKLAEKATGGTLPIDQNYYTEEEVWEGLKIVNKNLYDLGKSRNITLEELMVYTTVIENNDIEHDYVMEAIQRKLGQQGVNAAPLTILSTLKSLFTWGTENKSQEWWNETYMEFKDKDSKKYKLMLFEIMKELETQQNNSIITDIHTNLQNKGIQSTNESLKKTILTNLATLLGGAGALAWAIYEQVGANGQVCVNVTAALS